MPRILLASLALCLGACICHAPPCDPVEHTWHYMGVWDDGARLATDLAASPECAEIPDTRTSTPLTGDDYAAGSVDVAVRVRCCVAPGN